MTIYDMNMNKLNHEQVHTFFCYIAQLTGNKQHRNNFWQLQLFLRLYIVSRDNTKCAKSLEIV